MAEITELLALEPRTATAARPGDDLAAALLDAPVKGMRSIMIGAAVLMVLKYMQRVLTPEAWGWCYKAINIDLVQAHTGWRIEAVEQRQAA